MLETSLFTLLSGEPSISALVSDRIYPVLIPENPTMPCITWQIVGGMSKPTLDTTGSQKVRIQIDCWATDKYLTAATIRAAITQFLTNRIAKLSDASLATFLLIQPLDFYAGGDEAFRCGVEFYANLNFPGQ